MTSMSLTASPRADSGAVGGATRCATIPLSRRDPATRPVPRGPGRDLGVVLETQELPAPVQLEAPRDPGVVAQRLVGETGRLDSLDLAVGVVLPTADQAITEAPGR